MVQLFLRRITIPFFECRNKPGPFETKPIFYPFQVDLSKQDQMSSLKERLQYLPSVAGIVHSAMVLRDEFIKDLTFQSFIEVMGPKIKGRIH